MKKILSVFFLACCSCIVMAQDNVIDEIVWVVGDDAILRSDIETQRLGPFGWRPVLRDPGADGDTETISESSKDR